MAVPHKSYVEATTAVLGLLVERPDTVAGLLLRLEEQYPRARWPRTIVYNSIKSLVKGELATRTEQGGLSAHDWYEATSAGREYFSEWLGAPVDEWPVQRDALLAKLKHLNGADACSRIIRDSERHEEQHRRELNVARMRYQEAYRRGELTPAHAEDFERMKRIALFTADLLELEAKIDILRRVREFLEDPHGERDTLESAADG